MQCICIVAFLADRQVGSTYEGRTCWYVRSAYCVILPILFCYISCLFVYDVSSHIEVLIASRTYSVVLVRI